MDKPKRIHQKSMSLVLAFVLTLICVLTQNPVVFAADTGNEWVYDESNVISKDTEDYVKNLNENIFSVYKNKPQLAIIVIDQLPSETDIDSYKLDMFNKYGVGTADENCGMLFVLAIKDRKYGFEIGDGFERGSILREDLESDFITEEMKDSLRAEDYDSVVLQVTKHLEKIMADEENGVYAQRESDLKADGIVMVVILIGIFVIALIIAIGFIAAFLIRKLYRKKVIHTLIKEYQKQMQTAGLDENEFRKYFEKRYSYSKTDEVKKLFLVRLYNYYIDKETAKLKERNPKRSKFYKSYLEKINNQQSFQIGMIKSLDSICNEVDENIDINEKAIRNFFRENKDRVQNKEILPDLEQAYLSDCWWYDRKTTKEEMEKSFEKNTKRLNFEHEVDQFLSENKDSINKQYFDKAKFYRELEETDVYKEYEYPDRYNRDWMQAYLIGHISRNKADAEARRMCEKARRARANTARYSHDYDSSFGSGFGGGFSSGGGFSGGW